MRKFRDKELGGTTGRQEFRRRSCATLLLATLTLLVTRTAWTQENQEKKPDLTEVSIENLMNMEVTTVSKKEQKLARTAAAVFVITEEDIQRSGATNIPDMLRMVPGVEVAQINANTWAISVRGLNEQFSDKLLVMIDGRSVYTPTFGGVYWETVDVPLEEVYVITQEEIRESGATNIPDLLRMVPALDVAQINGNTWAISARGLNGQFSNELLVMMDGRNIYTPTSGGVFWDTLDLPLENIERIEVIRGPGATVWCENAVNGVVNIIRRKAGEIKGTLVSTGGGNTGEFATVEYGGSMGKRSDYRIFSRYLSQDEMRDVASEGGGDGWHLLRGGFRSDSRLSAKNTLTVQGDMYAGREGNPGTTLLSITAPGPVSKELFVNLAGGFVQGIWNHESSADSSSTLMMSFDQYERSDRLGDKRHSFNLDLHRTDAWGARQQIVWGGAYRGTSEHSEGSIEFSLNPPNQVTNVFSGFVQDEIAVIRERFYFTLGTKVESNTYSGFSALPSGRAVYEFSQRRMAWAAISRALRTPAEADVSLRVNAGGFTELDGTPVLISVFGNPRIKDEGLIAYEAGYRAAIGQHLSVDLAAYYNDERVSYRRALTSELSALAALGANATASLAFSDHQSAQDILAALRAEPHIVGSCLYDKHENLFAEYQRNGKGAVCEKVAAESDGSRFEEESVIQYRTISLGGEKAGAIAIISDLEELHAKIRQYTLISVAVILLSVLATFLVSSRLI